MKGALSLTALLLTAAFVPSAIAQTPRPVRHELKYDFVLVRKGEEGVASWGNWESGEQVRLKEKGPGLYVRKNGTTYVITDPDTVRKADAAIDDFKLTTHKLKEARHFEKNERKSKEIAAQSREQAEIGRKIQEAARAYAEAVRNGGDPQAEARFRAQMDEFHAKMGTSARKGWDSEAFGREMGQFGREMAAAAGATGDKIVGYIDEAFARGLARPV